MNLAQDALHVLQTVAPTIAKATLGPFGGLAATAISAILGTPPADEQAMNAAFLAATPDQLLALKKAENDFQAQIKTLGISEDKLAFDDTASARQMQAATRDPIVGQLAWLNVGGFLAMSIGVVVAIIAWPDQVAKVPAAAWATLGTIYGYLGKSASQSETFFFGSSAGSQAKDATLADIAKQP